ncbi:bactofilin family protein [Halostella salina]|uniref:bactofilin family protein n=1 Tax=Halostella salina TaxID=1547897 RepID=UPI0013CEBF58|nr:polymer-forming cytoskeletal protein [Halostella salina]
MTGDSGSLWGRGSRPIALVLAVLVVVALLPGVVAADENRTGDTVVVEEGETIDDDLSASAGNVIVRGTVTGDLQAFAGNVIIRGEVRGDVESFAGNVRITGDVGGDVMAVGGNVEVGTNGTVGGTLEAAGGTVTIAGTVDSARLAAGTITVTETGTVEGDLRYDGTLTVADGGTVGGETIQDGSLSVGPELPTVPWLGTLFGLLMNFLLGALLLLALPAFSARVGEHGVDRPLRSGGLGLLAVIAAPIVFVLFAITIIGLPIAFAWLLLFLLLAWLGSVYGAFVVGVALLALTEIDSRWLALVVGLVVVALVTQVPLLGGLFGLLVFLIGLGALLGVMTGGYRRRRNDRRAGDATPTPDAGSDTGTT